MSQSQQPTNVVGVSVVLNDFIPFYIHFGLLIELHIYTYTLSEASMLSGLNLYVHVAE